MDISLMEIEKLDYPVLQNCITKNPDRAMRKVHEQLRKFINEDTEIIYLHVLMSTKYISIPIIEIIKYCSLIDVTVVICWHDGDNVYEQLAVRE